MSHVSSQYPSRPRFSKKQSKLTLRRRFSLALCLLAVVMLPLALHLRAAGAQSVDPADAFSAKADKLLQRVYRTAAVNSGTAKSELRPQTTREQALEQPLTGDLEQLSQIVSLEPQANGGVKVSLTVRLAADTDESELRAAGFATGARIGNIVTVEAPADRLPELAALSSVRKMQAGVYRYPLNDRARRDVGIDNASGQRVVGQTGAGVVVGIIDTGIDFRHGDFRKADGTTRIKALLDMSDSRQDFTLPGGSTTFGHAYSEADINAALAGDAGAVLEKDLNGHGTHVAGTAAGNGLGGTSPGTYAGMAPEADLVIVKATRSTTSSARFGTNDTINALKFIQQQAAALGEPFVINMSLGGQLGPHDGTGADEQAIDNLVNGGPGRAVCVAAGNEGSDNIHASATVPAGGSLTLNFNLVSSSTQTRFIDLYNRNFDKYIVTVTRPDGTKAFDSVPFVSNGQLATDSSQLLQFANSTDPQNGQPDIFLIFKKDAPGGAWTITLQDVDTAPNGAFDAWTDGGDSTFTSNVDNNSHLVGSPGTARGAITVGAYVTRTAGNINIPSLVVGNYAYFTSSGPTADGRQKPEISAPGYYLYSSRSADNAQANYYSYGSGGNATLDSVHYGGLAGTSMATPVTAGSVALLLQANRSLSNDQIKNLLTGNASHDGFDPAGWNSHFGFGKLNIAAALNAAGAATPAAPTPTPTPVPTPTPTYSISGRVTDVNSNIVSGVTLTLTGTQSGATQIDANGNYIFTNLLAGTYTVTPSRAGYVFFLPSQTVNASGSVTLGNFTALNATQLDDTTFFVTQHYRDFLAREPDPGGLSYWSGLINQCNGDAQCIDGQRVSVSAAFFIEQEFQQTGNYVYRLYKGTLNRRPTFTEFNADRSQVIGGANLAASKQQFADAWTQRPEFLAKYPATLSNADFVNALVQTILQTSGVNLGGLPQQNFINEMAAGASRGQIIREAIEMPIFQQAEYNRAFVLMQYFGYLRRDPEQGGYDFWLGILTTRLPNDSSGYRAMVKAFITSIEYRARFPR